jgi:hypothetical protein
MVGTAEDGDQFGQALAVGDFDNDGVANLVVGVPFEDLGTTSSAGAGNVLYGTAGGLSGTGSQLFDQDSPELPDTAEAGDLFGAALAVLPHQQAPARRAADRLAPGSHPAAAHPT